ncbi:large subunit ribosomal protein L30e [Methanomicrobium sp. W14]|uniref:50S ribosomal protein L30e n=1 Tax=Methanomicrobium sp. W14 TaxID=2817839 RepID=UPI001AE2DC55|nr:50S ribosomal protein L30e [Methanomicrobium sp. W14]MBP2132714.1 large subunit ribosomal protein L30e [Methanomicrobium sp. W14]
MDFETSLRRAIKSGNVVIGQKETKDCISEGKAQMVVVADNCPDEFISYLKDQDVFSYTYEDSSKALGMSCGRPHFVSALAIVDAGDSDILSLKRV